MKYYITDENIIVKYQGKAQTWKRPFKKYSLFTLVGSIEEPLFSKRYYAIDLNMYRIHNKIRKLTWTEVILYFIAGKLPKY